MEDPKTTLGSTPDALKKRQVDVTLVDGSTVTVYKWSLMKFPELVMISASIDKIGVIAEASVAPEDREKVRGLDPEDVLAISTAATTLNVTPGVLKNLSTLLAQAARVAEAVDPAKRAPSNQS